MNTLTVRLDDDLEARLNLICEKKHCNRSDFIRDSLRTAIWLAEFESIRKELAPYARAAGLFTDEDVFREVS
jgi:predicted transcriptional regulator